MSRAYNFSAGPAVLPLPVLDELRDALPEFRDTRVGLMELSHRSAAFGAVIASAEARLRRLLAVPDDYAVLFLQGGASLQFFMSALNLLAPGQAADFLVTGAWSKKALKEARRVGDAQAVWDGEATGYDRLPHPDDYRIRDEAVYVHYTSNNTIYGTEYADPPTAADKPLVADMSSNIASRPLDVSAHAIIYAGAQKNLGPSGVTVVILSPWAIERSRSNPSFFADGLPSMLDYGLMVDKGSLFNTPNTFGIFAIERVLAWLEAEGGVQGMAERNERKARLLYDTLDSSDFWRPHAQPDSRSRMNVTWRLAEPDLEPIFLSEAREAGLEGLKGHRSVGGIRASIYNACPVAAVEALVDFMRQFERTRG